MVCLMAAAQLGRHRLLTGCALETRLMGADLVSCYLTLAYSLGVGSETDVRQRVSVSDALLLLAAPALRLPTSMGGQVG